MRLPFLAPVLDPQHPRVQAGLAGIDALRHPHLPVLGKVAPLVPRTRKRVVVVIPLYNYERYVADAMASALAQEHVDVHLVVVDDASTDGSLEAARAAAAGRDDVTVIANSTNEGPGVTFNRGWVAVPSDYVMRLDADDLLTPGALARSVALAEAAPTVGLVYGHFNEFEGEPPVPHLGDPFGVVWSGPQWLRHGMDQDRCLLATHTAIVRTSLMQEHGGWKPELRHTQDFEMWLRAATVSDVGRVFDADQALRRIHAVSLSTTESVGTVDFDQHLLAYDAWFEDVGHRLPDGQERLASARRALARRAVRTAQHAYHRAKPEQYAADELVELAASLDPDVRGLAYTRAVGRLQRRLGAAHATMPWSVLGASAYRIDHTVTLGRYRRTGL